MWDHVLVGPTCGTMRWWGPHVGPCADGSYMWDQVLVGPCVGWTRTHNYTWLHVGPDPCFLFFKLFCDDNIVALWRRFAFVIGSWREELEWFICDEIGSLFDDHHVSFIIILSVLAPSLIICDEVTKFVTVVTTSMTNKRNVTSKSS
jgi:hypothetical protein